MKMHARQVFAVNIFFAQKKSIGRKRSVWELISLIRGVLRSAVATGLLFKLSNLI